MGQYFLTVSLEKEEFIHPSSTKNTEKLTETAWQYNCYVFAIAKKLSTTWKDTRVITVGDYCSENYGESLPDDVERSFTLIKPRLGLPKDSSTEWGKWREVIDTFYNGKIFYNLSKKEYIRLGKYFEKRKAERENDVMIENPITLLLSTGNDGGGTFPEDMLGADYVGYWAWDFVGIKTGLSNSEFITWKDVTNEYIFDADMPKDVSPLIGQLPDFYESGISKGEDYIFATCLIQNGGDFFAFEYSPRKKMVFGCYKNHPNKKFTYLRLSSCFNIKETSVFRVYKEGIIT